MFNSFFVFFPFSFFHSLPFFGGCNTLLQPLIKQFKFNKKLYTSNSFPLFLFSFCGGAIAFFNHLPNNLNDKEPYTSNSFRSQSQNLHSAIDSLLDQIIITLKQKRGNPLVNGHKSPSEFIAIILNG